jgi:hypothetical protein
MYTNSLWRIIYIHIKQCRGQDRTEPCGTPALIIFGADISPSTETENFLFERKELMSLIKLAGKFILDNLYSKPLCHVASKALSISKNTAAVHLGGSG